MFDNKMSRTKKPRRDACHTIVLPNLSNSALVNMISVDAHESAERTKMINAVIFQLRALAANSEEIAQELNRMFALNCARSGAIKMLATMRKIISGDRKSPIEMVWSKTVSYRVMSFVNYLNYTIRSIYGPYDHDIIILYSAVNPSEYHYYAQLDASNYVQTDECIDVYMENNNTLDRIDEIVSNIAANTHAFVVAYDRTIDPRHYNNYHDYHDGRNDFESLLFFVIDSYVDDRYRNDFWNIVNCQSGAMDAVIEKLNAIYNSWQYRYAVDPFFDSNVDLFAIFSAIKSLSLTVGEPVPKISLWDWKSMHVS